MALGGWMSGAIYDLTGSYRAAFLNGIAWNLLNMAIAFWLLLGRLRPGRRRREQARRRDRRPECLARRTGFPCLPRTQSMLTGPSGFPNHH
jgi:hypothetical protein